MTKAVLSTLVGIACDRGAVDDAVAPLLPDLPLDPRLTVRHLLTMTAGLSSEIDDVMELQHGPRAQVAEAGGQAVRVDRPPGIDRERREQAALGELRQRLADRRGERAREHVCGAVVEAEASGRAHVRRAGGRRVSRSRS